MVMGMVYCCFNHIKQLLQVPTSHLKQKSDVVQVAVGALLGMERLAPVTCILQEAIVHASLYPQLQHAILPADRGIKIE